VNVIPAQSVTTAQKRPGPDFPAFRDYLLGRKPPQRLHFADLLIDDPILKTYTETVLKRRWVPRETDPHAYFQNYARCYEDMGFDYIPVHFWIQNSLNGFPTPETWIAANRGCLSTRAEYDAFPWNRLSTDYSSLDLLTEYLPDGMKIVVVSGDLQDLTDIIVGTASFLMMIYDDPELLDELITRWYSLKEDLYRTALQYPSVGAIFTAADFGSKSATLMAPEFIRDKLIPWYTRFSTAAHEAGRMYWFHSCGNLYTHNVIDLLLDDVKIDAFHSFQDEILPVSDFLQRYGSRTAALGGVDIDKLTSLEESALRIYVRETAARCLEQGRYALGSRNSIAWYVPLKNWMILLDEGRRFRMT
jgi:uroporphyrinogen decarboxylase